MILPQQLVPIVTDEVDESARATLNKVSAALTTADLVALNDRSVNQQLSAAAIASEWLSAKGLA